MADFEGLHTDFRKNLEQLVADSGGRIWIVSGYRSVEEQTQLWNDAVAKYGESEARNWVAPPGSSNHNRGWAADLGFSDGGREWAHANAARYGLHFPMDWEPWHIEPFWARDGGPPAGHYEGDGHNHGPVQNISDAYTTPPLGSVMPNDVSRNFDLGEQLKRLDAIVSLGVQMPSMLQSTATTELVTDTRPEI